MFLIMALEQYGNMDQHIICQLPGKVFVLCFLYLLPDLRQWMSVHNLFFVIWLLFGNYIFIKILGMDRTFQIGESVPFFSAEVEIILILSEVKINGKHHIIILLVSTLPIMVIFVTSSIINQPTPENEHLTNYELANLLELDNYTINNYVVGQRIRVYKFITILCGSLINYFNWDGCWESLNWVHFKCEGIYFWALIINWGGTWQMENV